MTRIGLFAAFVLTVVGANWALGRYDIVPVAPGLEAPAGVWFAGLAFGLRDALHERSGRPWVLVAFDNSCFSARWTPRRWLAALERHQGQPGCLFAVVPDVVCDAAATDARWRRWAPVVRDLGYRPCYVTQNGCHTIPDDAAALFTGGDDSFKLGAQARRLMQAAKARGLWCHMGRVNSLRRLRVAALDGYDSVDGTFLAYGPDANLPRLLRYLRHAAHPSLFATADHQAGQR